MFLRKLAVVLTAMATLGGLGVPAAHADADEDCWETIFDYGKVGLTACFRTYSDGRAAAEARFRIVSPTTPTLWGGCFVDLQIRDHGGLVRWKKQLDCMSIALTNGDSYVVDTVSFFGAEGNCYEVQAKWYGTYDNVAVGSHENANSHWRCYNADGLPRADLVNSVLFGLPV